MNVYSFLSRKGSIALLSGIFLLLGGQAFAQSIKCSGKVLDSKGEAIIGAAVVEVGKTSNGSISDIDGSFSLQIAAGKRVEVSCIGYQSRTLVAQNPMTIVLEEDTTILEETVVIGYGSVKKSDLTSAVVSMDSRSIEDRPMARAEEALQGALAGVTVSITNAEPGAGPQIRVRGAASINAGNSPLYVIDGVPQSSMNDINPNDIADIQVLKDAASSAIYGSRGSNGVVIVSTKQGKKGTPKITINASYSLATLEKKVDILNSIEWMELAVKCVDANYLGLYPQGKISDDNATRLRNVKQTSPTYGGVNGVVYDERWFQYLSPEVQNAHTYTPTNEQLSLLDWQDYLYKPASTQNYGITVSGATEKTKYMYSLGYMDQDGLFPASNFKRISLRTNLETKVNDYFSIGVNVAPTFVINKGSGRGNGKDTYGHHALSSTPVSGPGVGYNTWYNPNPKYLWAGSAGAPKEYIREIAPKNTRLGIQASTTLKVTPIKDLSIEGTASVNYYHNDNHSFNNATDWKGNWLTKKEGEASSASHSTSWSANALFQVVANYNKNFGRTKKHTIDAMVGTSAELGGVGFSTNQSFSNLANDVIRGSFSGSSTTTTPKVSGSSVNKGTQTRLLSIFGRVQYNYGSRYLLSASLRYDGYSRFGSENKWGLFPSVSAGWMLSSERFFKDSNISSWWNTLKIRASYGQTGNNGVGESAAYSTLSTADLADYLGYVAGAFGNPNLGWEKTNSTDVAVDLGFLDNRIQASVDWYTKTTTDLLYSVPVPSAFGTSTSMDNLGSVYNTGVELELTTHNFTGDFKWDTQFNVSWNRNEVRKLGAEDTPVYTTTNGATYALVVGRPMYEFLALECEGVWKNQAEIDQYIKETGNVPKYQGTPVKPGDLRHKDITGEGNINNDDRQFLGKPNPSVVFGMTNRFSYKGFDASVLFTAQTGGYIMGAIGRAIDRAGMGYQTNAMGWWRDAWWSEEDPGNGWVPFERSTVKPDSDSRFIHKSDYFRIKNLTLGYTIPFKKVVSSARVYVSCENLLIFDSYYHGYSPEASNMGRSGMDYGAYPSARTFTFGLNINF